MSFVIDWFWNVSSVLDALRLERDMWHYFLIARIESTKFTVSSKPRFVETLFGPRWFALEPLTGKYYRRIIRHSDWGHIDPFSVSGGTGFGYNQQIDGLALFTQRVT